MFFCSLENTNSASNLFSLFFCCCFAADEPVLRDNEALRSKCLVPMVSFMSLPCCFFLQVATGSLIRSLMLCFDIAEWYRDGPANHCWRLHRLLLFRAPWQELRVYLPWAVDSSQSKLVMHFLRQWASLRFEKSINQMSLGILLSCIMEAINLSVMWETSCHGCSCQDHINLIDKTKFWTSTALFVSYYCAQSSWIPNN